MNCYYEDYINYEINKYYLLQILKKIFFHFSVLAKGFMQCKKSDPKLGECIKNALQSGIPHLVKGIF